MKMAVVRVCTSGTFASGTAMIVAGFSATGAVVWGRIMTSVQRLVSGAIACGKTSVSAPFCTSAKGGTASGIVAAQIGAVAGAAPLTGSWGNVSASGTDMSNRS